MVMVQCKVQNRKNGSGIKFPIATTIAVKNTSVQNFHWGAPVGKGAPACREIVNGIARKVRIITSLTYLPFFMFFVNSTLHIRFNNFFNNQIAVFLAQAL